MTLPELLDSKALQAELGVSRAVADRIMQRLPVVRFPDVRKVYCRRDDVCRYVDEHTITDKR